MIVQDQAGGEGADAEGRAAKQGAQHRYIAHQFDDRLLDMKLKPGREYEQAPDAVDDGRDTAQKLDGDAYGAAQGARAQFGEEDGNADAYRQRDRHGDDAGDQGAIDRSKRAKPFPGWGCQASVTMTPKPKALKAGVAPITREMMTPAKIASTANAASMR